MSHDDRGMEYYHQCPALSLPEWEALPPSERARRSPGENRRNHRDENILLDAEGKSRGPKADGPGREEMIGE